MERERKFLVPHLPPALKKYPHKRIRQGYLATSDRSTTGVQVRVRDAAGKHTLTVKSGGGGSREEIELPLPAEAFRKLWPLTRGHRVEKVRYDLPLGKLTIELDVYAGKLRGLRTAEVEFASHRALKRFRPPDWLGREVTEDDRFSNTRLATLSRAPRMR